MKWEFKGDGTEISDINAKDWFILYIYVAALFLDTLDKRRLLEMVLIFYYYEAQDFMGHAAPHLDVIHWSFWSAKNLDK